MKSLSPLTWLVPFVVMFAALASFAVSQATPPLEGTGAVSAFDYWLERYQALTAGILALSAGALALAGILMQVRSADRRHEVEQQNDMERVFQERAILAASLSGEIVAMAEEATEINRIAATYFKGFPEINMEGLKLHGPSVYPSTAHEVGLMMSPFFAMTIPAFYACFDRWHARSYLVRRQNKQDLVAIDRMTETLREAGHELAVELEDFSNWARSTETRAASKGVFRHDVSRCKKILKAFGYDSEKVDAKYLKIKFF